MGLKMTEQIDKSKRNFLRGGLAGLATLFFGTGCVTSRLQSQYADWVKTHPERFGTVESPVYSVQDISQDEELSALDSLALQAQDTNELSQKLNSFNKKADILEHIYDKLLELSGHPDYRNTPELEIACLKQSLKLSTLGIEIDETLINYLGASREYFSKVIEFLEKREEDAIRRQGSEEAFANRVFTSLTGRPLPDDISVRRRDLMRTEDNIGIHDPFKGEIQYGGLQYLTNVVTLLHEYGHVCAQHGEQRLARLEKGKKPDVDILEEACAYAFTNAAAHHIAAYDRELAVLMKGCFDYGMSNLQVELYEEPEKYEDEHNRGAELFVATRQVLKDPAKVFNYLATLEGSSLENLDPRVKEQIQRNRERYEASKIVEKDFKDIRARVSQLSDKSQTLVDSIKTQ